MKQKFLFLACLVAGVSLFACGGGGGSGPARGGFAIVGVNLANGTAIGINQPIELQFNQAVDLSSVSLGSTVNLQGTSSNPNIIVPPAAGLFFLKPGSEGKALIFQPNCPTDSANSNGGLMPSDELGVVTYTLSVLDSSSNREVLKSDLGTALSLGTTISFTTFADNQPFLDPLQSPPVATNADEIDDTISLNLLSDPASPIMVAFDQPLKASRFSNDWVFLRYEDPLSPGNYIAIPSELVIADNCNDTGTATLSLTVLGTLPSDTQIELVQSKEVEGLGINDFGSEDTILKTIEVSPKSTTQPDAIVELFSDTSRENPAPEDAFPLASWGEGQLQAATPFPGPVSVHDIEIGKGTANGFSVTLDTTGSTLLDTQGQEVAIVDGIIYCRNFTLKRDTTGTAKHGKIIALGPNPLRIVATENVNFEASTQVLVQGVDSPGVTTVSTGNLAEPGAFGRCTGGNGGDASTVLVGSTPRGSDGNGPFNTPGKGGKGGESGYGFTPVQVEDCPYIQVHGAGGGGGHFIDSETDGSQSTPTAYFYARHSGLFAASCTSGTMTTSAGTTAPGNPPCDGAQPSTNTAGEDGKRGPYGCSATVGCTACPAGVSTEDNVAMTQETAQNGGCPAPIKSAVSFSAPPLGGAKGDPIFGDDDSTNNFWGKKFLPDGTVIFGELATPQGGAGGGGGGDAVANRNFPPPSNHDYIINDFKGSGAGGGGGVFWVQALGRITVDGELSADGGSGGHGEQPSCVAQAGGGSGGGAGGMIILESATGITLGSTSGQNPKLHANGGDRGFGTSLKTASEKCSQNLTCIGGPGNWAWVDCCVTGNQPSGGVAGIPGRSRRTNALSWGGAGGKGLIILGVPHNEDGTLQTDALVLKTAATSGNDNVSTCTSGNSCYDTTLGVLRFAETVTSVSAFNSNARFDPDPHVVVPSFGAVSKAYSEWIYLGSAADTSDFSPSSPLCSFSGTNPSGGDAGEVNFALSESVLVSASSGVTIESNVQATISNSTLYSAVSANPKILIGDHLVPNSSSGDRFSITNVEIVSAGVLRVYTDPDDGAMSSAGSWELICRSFDVLSDGSLNTLPSNNSIKLQFQSADETSEGSGEVDESSISSLSVSASSLDTKRFVRFVVTFSLADSGTPEVDAILPTLDFVKIPYTY